MHTLSRGDRIQPGHYAVYARFARSLLLRNTAGHTVFVVDRSIGPGPLNLVVSDPHVYVSAETFRISRHDPAPRFDSRLPKRAPDTIRRLQAVLRSTLARHAPPESLVSLFFPTPALPRQQHSRDLLFRRAFSQIAAGRLASGIRIIRGCGTGLTPSGDDFLCGWMLACRLLRRPALAGVILPLALSTNPVSNAFLELSAAGRVHLAMQRLLEAPSLPRAKAVCTFGHTSGADLLCGLLWGLDFPPLPEPFCLPRQHPPHQQAQPNPVPPETLQRVARNEPHQKPDGQPRHEERNHQPNRIRRHIRTAEAIPTLGQIVDPGQQQQRHRREKGILRCGLPPQPHQPPAQDRRHRPRRPGHHRETLE